MRRRHIIAAAAAAALMLPLLPATTSWADAPEPIPVGVEKQPSVSTGTNTIIVTFDRNQTDPAQAAKDAVERTGTTVAKVSPITEKTVTVTLDPTVTAGETAKIGDRVEAVDGVRAAEPAATFTTGSTNDTYYSYLWNVSPTNGAHSVNAETAWPTTTGTGVVVGVIDTGITGHSDLSGTAGSIVGGNLVAGYDFITSPTAAGDGDGRDANPTDAGDWSAAEYSSWHGTHVSGTIAAIRNNKKGVVGVAPGAKVQPIRALGKGGGSESDIIASIYWGAGLGVAGAPTNPTPAKVLNMSIGATTSCSYAMQNAINAAVNAGVTIVVAAGNEGSPVATSMPANCSNVISVAATGPTGAIAEYSNYGNATRAVTIAAPGGSNACSTDSHACIASTWNSGKTTPGTEVYGLMAGTSMAAPHVSAAAALLKSANPRLTPAQIQTLLTGNTTALASCGALCGAGLLNVGKAVAAATYSPVNSLATPVTSGTATVGATLTTLGAGATGASYSYQWLRSGTAITGATLSRYALVAADQGKAVAVTVTATYSGKSASKTSAARTVAANPVTKLVTPAITGTAMVGATLTTVGAGATGAGYTYQWRRGASPIAAATGPTYRLAAADAAIRVSVTVTASRYGQSASRTSAGILVAANTVATLGVPKITGTAKVGSKLTTLGSGSASAAYTYRWLRNGTSISGATRSSYTLAAVDLGRTLTVTVTATRYAVVNTKTSLATPVVKAGTFSKSKSPYTSGKYKTAKTVTARAGTWSPTATTVTYQWLKSGATIVGATASTYKLPRSMKRKYISVTVTVTRAGYTTRSATSARHKVS